MKLTIPAKAKQSSAGNSVEPDNHVAGDAEPDGDTLLEDEEEVLEEELEGDVTVVATGGLAGKIVPHCRRVVRLDEDLLLKGLAVIYQKNRR